MPDEQRDRALNIAASVIKDSLSEKEIRDRFDLSYHTRHVDEIFDRVFGPAA